MPRRGQLWVSLIVWATMGSVALAQAPDDQTPTVLEEIVVEGQLRDDVRRAVERIAPQGGLTQTLGRFEGAICPATINVSRDLASVLIDRIARAGEMVGLRVRDEGCTPNIRVIALKDTERTLPLLVHSWPDFFRPGCQEAGCQSAFRIRQRREAFLASTAPVRWFHVVETVSSNDRLRPLSRLITGSRDVITHAVAVVDLDRLPEVDLAALGDYLAMVSLAEVNQAEPLSSLHSVLTLFGEGRPEGLTDFDQDYLRALYGSPNDATRRSRQQAHIAWFIDSQRDGRSDEDDVRDAP